MLRKLTLFLALGTMIGASSFVVSCNEGAARFDVRVAPGTPTGGRTASVFGVFKEGRMSPESWADLAPALAGALGGRACPLAIDEDLAKRDVGLAAAVDDKARELGVTDELLDRFGASSKGELILAFTIAGHPPTMEDAGPSAAPMSAPASMRGNRRMPGMSGGGDVRPPRSDGNAFEVSATFFSVPAHRSVAVVSMQYTGATTEEALRDFSRRLAKEFPGLACAGWNREVAVDEATVRAITSD